MENCQIRIEFAFQYCGISYIEMRWFISWNYCGTLWRHDPNKLFFKNGNDA
jgi:hypothetical protein